MQKRMNTGAAAAVSALLALSVVVTSATTVIPPMFEELTDRAELVFVGKVASVRGEWRNVGVDRAIFTMVEFETEEILKGDADRNVTLQFLGGTVDDVTMEVTGVPSFTNGDRVVLFVEKNGVQFSPLVGVFHGKFGLRKDKTTGGQIVVMHDGQPLRDVAEIGTGEGAEFAPKRAAVSIPENTPPMSLDAFRAKVREHLEKRPAQK